MDSPGFMRLSLFKLFLLSVALVTVAAGQQKRADSDPVLRGSASYTMPQSAVDAEIAGTIVVAVRIDETGKPTSAAIMSGPMWPCGTEPAEALQELASTVSDTMMKLRFSPAVKDKKPRAKNIGLTLELKNSKLATGAPDLDAAGKPKPRQISGGVLNGKATLLAKPAYPSSARAAGESGAVSIQILVDEEGRVIRAGSVNGAQTLQLAAREAACKSKFSPTRLAGHPVKVSGVVTYNFVP